MATITSLPVASTIDSTADVFPIVTNSINTTQQINRNTFLNLTSQPVGINDTQVLTNKTLTNPTINGATLSGTLSGTYTIGGTPTFPSSITQNTATQTLTNKTLTSPTINSPTITNATISSDAVTGYTTSNSGTIYGIPISLGTMNGSYLAANSITNSLIATGNLYTTKIYNPYKFNVFRNAALNSGSSGFAVITFDNVNFDTSGNYNTSTGKFTAPVNGYYYFSSRACVTTGSTNRFFILLYKNGSEILRGNDNSGVSGAPNGSNVSGILSLNAGDYIQVFNYYATTASALETGTNTCYFTGFLVSAT